MVVFRDFSRSWLGMDFALKQFRDSSALLLQLRYGLCDTLNHLSFFCGDHSLSKYAITTILLITVFTFVKKKQAWTKVLDYKAKCEPVTSVCK